MGMQRAESHRCYVVVFLGHLFNLNGTCFVPKCYAQHTREMSHAHQRCMYNCTRKIHAQSHKEDHVHLTWPRCSSSSLDCLSKQGPERRTREQRISQDFSDIPKILIGFTSRIRMCVRAATVAGPNTGITPRLLRANMQWLPCQYCGFALPYYAHRRPKRCRCLAAVYCNELCRSKDWKPRDRRHRRDWPCHKYTCTWVVLVEHMPELAADLVCRFAMDELR